MRKDIAKMPMPDRLQHLFSVVSGQRFLNKQGLGNEVPFAMIKDRLRYFEEDGYQKKVLCQMVALAKRNAAPQENPLKTGGGEVESEPHEVKETTANYVHFRSLQVVYDKPWLADEADVDRYLTSLREALLKEIQQSHKVQI